MLAGMGSRPVEKAVAVPGRRGEPALGGVFLNASGEPRGGAVVAPPHPLYGGSMDHPVVNELSWACSSAGFASLRFDWRGVGASTGTPSGEAADADADYGAALDHIGETVEGAIVACGYSFGAGAAVRASAGRPRVRRLVLVAPVPALIDAAALRGFGGSVLAISGARDALAPPDAVEALLAPAAEARLVVIPDADHFFGVGLAAISRAVTESLTP
jgi:alpha/beta superfamily hydrolase